MLVQREGPVGLVRADWFGGSDERGQLLNHLADGGGSPCGIQQMVQIPGEDG
ncbi:hypothetical protein [Citricoccus sp. I39-566]|uniref:hypothetical protein n=1 Tax=Citricoccus sp. I39-566 TaxID=3073268 RepID=UPI00286CDE51|nr:hypothetical protein [Citricoccus sp. I39-566]WMY80063.1 hypothetical protein RE421_16745 [Citricoccus sp. I39-566]